MIMNPTRTLVPLYLFIDFNWRCDWSTMLRPILARVQRGYAGLPQITGWLCRKFYSIAYGLIIRP